MTQQEQDAQIRRQYNEYDEKFRAAKKRGDHKTASQWKTKRDALEAKVNEAIKRAAGK
jgi:hypothetical protein